jgi:hypothetical protein
MENKEFLRFNILFSSSVVTAFCFCRPVPPCGMRFPAPGEGDIGILNDPDLRACFTAENQYTEIEYIFSSALISRPCDSDIMLADWSSRRNHFCGLLPPQPLFFQPCKSVG